MMAASLTAKERHTRGPRTWASWTTSPCQCASSASYATLERTREEETERFNVPVHQRTCTSHALHILDASPRRPSPSSSTSADHDRSRMRRRHSGMPIAYTLRPDTCVTRNMAWALPQRLTLQSPPTLALWFCLSLFFFCCCCCFVVC